MITFKELITDHQLSDIPLAIQHNLEELLTRINIIRTLWGKPMIVTSGYRTEQDQLRINPKSAKTSRHLAGKAVDILDQDGSLYAWLKANEGVLIASALWCEEETKGWVHFQIESPGSGKRWFFP